MDPEQPEPLQVTAVATATQEPHDHSRRALATRAWVRGWITAAVTFAAAYAVTITGLYVIGSGIDTGPLLDPLAPALLFYGGVATLSLASVSLLSMALLAVRKRTRLAGFVLIIAAGILALAESVLAVTWVGEQTVLVAVLAALAIAVTSGIGGAAVHAVGVTGRHRGES